MKILLTAGAFCLLLPMVGVQADMNSMGVAEDPMAFVNLDKDRNGSVSRDEAESIVGLSQGFDAADRNQDGALDPAELASALPADAATE